jgi:transposase-like protein
MSLFVYRAFIASETACLRLLRQLRWPDGIRCPGCEHRRVWRMREAGRVEYRCKRCGHHFSDTSGTIFARSRTPLSKWVLAIGLFRIGVSARALGRELCVSYKTAWHLLTTLRRVVAADGLLTRLAGHVEVDETYFGGRQKGKRGRGAAHKTAVVGLRQRDGRVRSLVVPNVQSPTLRAAIRQHVRRGSTVYTDSYTSYGRVRRDGYRHRRLDHTTRFVRGRTHTQHIEGYWEHLKPQLTARHRQVAPHRLQGYLAEADFKFNTRKTPDFIALMLGKLIEPYPRRG